MLDLLVDHVRASVRPYGILGGQVRPSFCHVRVPGLNMLELLFDFLFEISDTALFVVICIIIFI